MPSFSKITSFGSSDDDNNILELRRGPWTLEEDSILIHDIACHGEGRWNMLAKRSGLKRTGKSCRLRWLNYLTPDVKRGNLTPQEQLLILDLHCKWGNRWSKIAQHLPGRTDNEIKNYWRTRVQKQAKHLKIDANSTKFQELIRCLWMPRLLQKIQGSSPPPSLSSLSSSSSSLSSSSSSSSSSSLSSFSLDMLRENSMAVEPRVHAQLEPKGLEKCTKDSSSGNCLSWSINSTFDESIHSSQISQPLEYPISPLFQAMGNSECYNVENIETFPPAAMEYIIGKTSNPISVESSWVDYQMEDNLWNMDEFWVLEERREY